MANNVFLCCLHLVTAVICSGCVYEQRPTVEKHIQMMRCSSARLKRLGCWGLHRLSVTIKNVSNRELLISRSFMSIVTYPDQGLHENERMHHENLSCFTMNGEDFATVIPGAVHVVSCLLEESLAQDIISHHVCDVLVEYKQTDRTRETLRLKVFPVVAEEVDGLDRPSRYGRCDTGAPSKVR